jgi:hypothetical protein
MKSWWVAALATVVMGLTACGGGGEAGADPAPPDTSPVAGGPTPGPLPPTDPPLPSPPFSVGGVATGLAGTVTLLSNLGDRLDLSANGAYAFAPRYAADAPYRVEIERQPAGQRCALQAASGVVDLGDVQGIHLSCQAAAPEQPPQGAPLPPLQLDVAYGTKSYTLTWSVVPGATSYRVGRDMDGDGPAGAVEDSTTQTFTARANVFVPDEARATVYVRACNAAGCSARSRLVQPSALQMIGEFVPPTSPASDRYFGNSVTTSADGSVLAIAQPLGTDRGVHIYVRTQDRYSLERIFRPAGVTWISGLAVSGDGRFVALGDTNASNNQGRVHVLDRNTSAVSELAAAVAGNGDDFGTAISLSTDGTLMVIGASGEDAAGQDPMNNAAAGSGAAYVFARNGATWQQQAFLKAGAPAPDSMFGYKVSMAGNGSRIAVGALGEPSSTGGINPVPDTQAPYSGAVHTYVRVGNDWLPEAFIKAPHPDMDDMFGYAVKLSESGDTLVVTAPGESSSATWGGGGDPAANDRFYSGAAFVYTFANDTWTLERYLKAPVAREFGVFGTNVAMDASGTLVAISATGDPTGALGIDGDTPTTGHYDSGAVHLFRKVAGAWTYSHFVKSRRTQTASYFGLGLDLSRDGKTMPVGSPYFDQATNSYVGRVDLY